MGHEPEWEAVAAPVEPNPPRATVPADELEDDEVAEDGTLAVPLPASVRLTVWPPVVEYERHDVEVLDEELDELVELACRGIRQPGCMAGVIPGGHGAAPRRFGGSKGCPARWFER